MSQNSASRESKQDVQLIADATAYAKEWMSQYDSSHDWSHVSRVLKMAHSFMRQERESNRDVTSYDETTVTLAALLHDVGDRKYMPTGTTQNPKYMVQDFLTREGATWQLARGVQDIINHVSYSKEVADPDAVTRCLQRHPELAVVQDADRLDALGAVGIARCFTYSAIKGDQQASITDAFAHFDDKLLHLEGMMKTQHGRDEAKKRSTTIRHFMAQWQAETGD